MKKLTHSITKKTPSVKGFLALLLILMTVVPTLADGVACPHVTERTKYIKRSTTFNSLEFNPVSEGIFALQENNLFGFWTIDGKCLFETMFENVRDRPLFDHGAAVVRIAKANAKGIKPIMIVYADGSSRELPESYKEVSQFHDGVATVMTGGMGVKKSEYFCINTRGERIWPSLGPGDILEVGYLRDGLRRVKVRTEPSAFRYVTRWGFIDDKGNWVIQPNLREVREFKNGYALVISEDEKMQFINTKGELIYKFEDENNRLSYAKGISDVSNGCFMREANSNEARFFDLKGNCLTQYARATGFSNNYHSDFYAFVQADPDSAISVIDSKFQKIRNIWGLKQISAYKRLGPDNPEFGRAELGTFDKSVVVTPDGLTVIKAADFYGKIGNFIPDVYAPAEDVTNAPGLDAKFTYLGYINRTGEYMVVFDGEHKGRGLTPADSIPELNITTDAKYKVTVVASPAEGGQVSGGGEYIYGDTIKVGARVNKGWMLSGISSDNQFSATSKINEFVVMGDTEITVHFLKDITIDEAPTGIFSGDKNILEINDTKATGLTSLPIYLETSASGDIKSPYGDATQGFMAIMLDPDQTLVFESVSRNNNKRKGTFTLNAFFVPMKVEGQIEENGQKYLVLDGGVMKTNNMMMVHSGAQAADVSALETLMVNLMLMFDGADVVVPGGRYRIAMNDIDASTGAFTFGMMERLHPQYGWIAAGSDAFKNIERGFFITKVDTGFPADYFNGIRMTPSEKRNDVLWSPTPGFFKGDKTAAEDYASRLGQSFREFQSEYDVLKDIDLQSINAVFDSVIKPK